MEHRSINSRTLWLVVGVLAGLCVAYMWPAEPALAVAVDRANQYAVATCPVSAGRAEGIFVLDFLTGRLEGRVLNPSLGRFTHTYFRNVAADFKLPPKGSPQYTIVAGEADLPSIGAASMANGVIYVAEMRTGKVICYAFPFNESNAPVRPIEIAPLDGFQFRESVAP